jgi:hypothetical protein
MSVNNLTSHRGTDDRAAYIVAAAKPAVLECQTCEGLITPAFRDTRVAQTGKVGRLWRFNF